jgi:hypothetical protein
VSIVFLAALIGAGLVAAIGLLIRDNRALVRDLARFHEDYQARMLGARFGEDSK